MIIKIREYRADDGRFHDAYGKTVLVKRIAVFENIEHITEWAKCLCNESAEFVAEV